ncbi:MAG: AAA family ATPase [Bacteroidales bacterium]|nr:AAA family ATPase [Bacteroidales bacterium]MCF8391402.1 AAA family ATPase [Bacteroidales bacterium]
MLKNYIYKELLDNLGLKATPGQEQLLEKISGFISNPGSDELFLIKGYAGTGKTTIVNTLVRTFTKFKQQSVLLAPTGRAAKVLSSYTGKTAYTIHKKIYRQKSGQDGLGQFVLDKNFHKNCYFIVDEASMIGDRSPENGQFGSGDLLGDLQEYVNQGQSCHLILIGDLAQLPPVGLDISPALNPKKLQLLNYNPIEVYLRDVVRQSKESGILENATILRRMIEDRKAGNPKFQIEKFDDIVRITGVELVDEIENSYSKYGEGETIIISRSNKRANRFNAGIRNQILWREEEISIGDLLMIVKNNYFWIHPEENLDFIANGDIARIERIHRHENLYGYHYADVSLSLPDFKDLTIEARIMVDTLMIDSASLPIAQQKDLFQTILEDYSDELPRKERIKKVMENTSFNALQVKFAYAVTCHKAQGGQWKSVFVDPGYFTEGMMNIEYLRWLYTAFTRATEKLYLVNFPDEFFD